MNNNYPKKFSDLIQPIQKEIILTILLSILGTVSILIAPIFITLGMTQMTMKHWDVFILYIIFAGVGLMLRQLLHTISLGYAHFLEAKFRYTLRKDFSEKLSKLPLGFFTNYSSGAIRKFISEDIVKIHTIVAHVFTELAAAVALPLACIITMLVFEWRTGIMIVGGIFLIVLIGVFWMGIKGKNLEDVNNRYEKSKREVSHSAVELVDGIKEIKNFGMSGAAYQRFDDHVNEFSKTSYEWLSFSSGPIAFLMSAVQPAMMLFLSSGICFFSVYMEWLRPEQSILFILLSMILPSSLIGLMKMENDIKESKHSMAVILSIYAEPDQIYKNQTKPFALGDIVFENVDFSYDDKNLVLNQMNCVMKKGELTALVGSSGSGKTSMIRLIARFWDVTSGRVSIGGINIKDLSQNDLLSHIALVFQDVSLMNGSIAENIGLSNPSASREAIIKAAKAAYIHDKIMTLPNGYDAIYGEDHVVLSGGEKQRLTIARAFLADKPIVLLDEATAQADAESEVKIQQSLIQLCKNKTVIMIAHRLSTIVNADNILVLENGELKEYGRHQELIQEEGLYKKLWDVQHISKGGM